MLCETKLELLKKLEFALARRGNLKFVRPRCSPKPRPYALQRLDWTGEVPFEIQRITATPDGFLATFTQPVDPTVAVQPLTYKLESFTHIYQQGYGSPEVDQTTPRVTRAEVSADGLRVHLSVAGRVQGHVHAFDLGPMRSADGQPLVHVNAYYTLNEIPEK